MSNTGKSNRTGKVLKAMGVFSGVQFITLASGLIRTKLVAIWIGAAGVGLFGIYNSAIDLLSTVVLLGIGTSAVRDIAGHNTPQRIAETSAVLKRWGLFLGLCGCLLMVILSPLLSRRIFHDTKHIIAFAMLGICILANGINAGQVAIMQGTQQLKNLARSTITGVVIGVVVSIPIIYFIRANGIPLAIVACAISIVVSARMFGDYPEYSERITLKQVWREGRGFVRLGFFMMLSQALTLGATFIFIAWLTSHAGAKNTGFFQAGFTLFNRYVGLVFTALAVEFYPRLAAGGSSRRYLSVITSHELLLVCAILMPLLTLFAAVTPVIVRILYSSEFLSIVPFVTIALCGTVLRAASWCIGFSMIVHGDGRIMLLTEGLSAILYLILNYIGWHIAGLTGLGWAYIIWYILYTGIVTYVYRHTYHQYLTRNVIQSTGITLLCVATSSVLALSGLWVVSLLLAIPASIPIYLIFKHAKK